METLFEYTEAALKEDLSHAWQGIVDTLMQTLGLPAALIQHRLDPSRVEVLCASEATPAALPLGHGLALTNRFCGEVVRTKARLRVTDAAKDVMWQGMREAHGGGYAAYFGLPLLWPDGEVFGTICVLDVSPNSFEGNEETLLSRFRTLIEAHLALIHSKRLERKDLEDILDNLPVGILVHGLDRRLLFFNRVAEEVTGYGRDEILGRDCHAAFGSPFCGGRCTFRDGPPHVVEPHQYPLNILSKQGVPKRIEMNISPIGRTGQGSLGVIASFRDLTDLIGLKIRHGEVRSFAGIVGRDPKMLQLYSQIQELSTNDYPVCITGETGTGKELVAAAIHNESRRGGGPFVPVNGAALPEGLLESELFGHVKGAFTGAVRDKKGRFELAHGGTLFLDEVAELPRVLQAKLLRVLQEGTFERVGGEGTLSVDVRLITATNRNLKQDVEKGRFREDLYYRINVVPIQLPPLRERKGDIPLLLEHFMAVSREEGQETPGLSREALSMLTSYPWRGNVRELQSALHYALVKARGRIIQPEHLPLELKEWKTAKPTRGPSRKLDMEKVQAALLASGGNKAKAARMLEVGRATLYRFLTDHPDVS
jgi:PAS domain S-box-containing protein